MAPRPAGAADNIVATSDQFFDLTQMKTLVEGVTCVLSDNCKIRSTQFTADRGELRFPVAGGNVSGTAQVAWTIDFTVTGCGLTDSRGACVQPNTLFTCHNVQQINYVFTGGFDPKSGLQGSLTTTASGGSGGHCGSMSGGSTATWTATFDGVVVQGLAHDAKGGLDFPFSAKAEGVAAPANPVAGNVVAPPSEDSPGGTATLVGGSGDPTGPEIAIAATLILILIGVPVSIAGVPDNVGRVFGRLRGVDPDEPDLDPNAPRDFDDAARRWIVATADMPGYVFETLTEDEPPLAPPQAQVPPPVESRTAMPPDAPAADDEEYAPPESGESAAPPPQAGAQPVVVTPAQIDALNNRFSDSVREMVADGYWVKNHDVVHALWNDALDANAGPWNRLGDTIARLRGDPPISHESVRGGRCEEFDNWGRERAGAYVKEIFGPHAEVSDIYVEKAPTNLVAEIYNAVHTENHVATRVVLPDGQRYVLDYWDGVGSGNPTLQTEDQWVAKWKPKIERLTPGDAVVRRSEMEDSLKDLVNRFAGDEQRAFNEFRHQYRAGQRDGVDIPSPRAEELISRWESHPWLQ